MPDLLSLLVATCRRSTHQRFALDALRSTQSNPGRRLSRWLLRHHGRFLSGAIDPDVRFCDYQNHVIHVNEGYWGGAPRLADRWYQRLQSCLLADRFADAAHAAGVLSHYFTDVMQPLHTQVGRRERSLHGPIEIAVLANYDTIERSRRKERMRVVFQFAHHHGWLGEAMLHAARFSNRRREDLLAGFGFEIAARDPSRAFNSQARFALTELFGIAIEGLAKLLERSAEEAEAARGARLPDVDLSPATASALMVAPFRLAGNWLQSRQQSSLLSSMAEEWLREGELQEWLPGEVDLVHRVVRVYRDELRWKEERQQRLASSRTRIDVGSRTDEVRARRRSA